MNRDPLEIQAITIESQSLAEYSEGKKIFGGFKDALDKYGFTPAKLLSVGVLEGGMQSGKPSVMFLLELTFKISETKSDTVMITAEIAASNMVAIYPVISERIEHFQKAFEHAQKKQGMT